MVSGLRIDPMISRLCMRASLATVSITAFLPEMISTLPGKRRSASVRMRLYAVMRRHVQIADENIGIEASLELGNRTEAIVCRLDSSDTGVEHHVFGERAKDGIVINEKCLLVAHCPAVCCSPPTTHTYCQTRLRISLTAALRSPRS